jgi:hypothetical protein
MLNDAAAGKFQTIFCWDQDRFGRFNIWRAGMVISPLIDAGVKLITVSQGLIDWENDAGSLVYVVNQAQKHTFLHDLARNCLRGQLANIDRGSWIRKAPIGLCRVFSDETGVEQRRAEWDERFRKPKGWSVTLDIGGRLEEVEAMKWAFKTYAETDCGLLFIGRELAIRGVLTRNGTQLQAANVRQLLENPKYTGQMELGRFCDSKFYSVNGDGEICPRAEVQVNGAIGTRTPFRVIEDAHPALIDVATFDAVQRKLLRRKDERHRQQSSTWLLSGILRCGLCGGNISGSGNRYDRSFFYRCTGHVRGTCSGPMMNKDVIEQYAADQLSDLVTGDESIERLRQHVIAELKGRNPDRKLMALRTRIQELTREIGNRQRAVGDLEHHDDVRIVNEHQAESRRQLRDAEQRTLHLLQNGTAAGASLEHAAIANVLNLRERFASGDSMRMRAVLREVFDHITLHYTHFGLQNVFTHGQIVMHPF